ncbi:MAG: PA14 domain-containing protein, partial [Cytophagales bacterium]
PAGYPLILMFHGRGEAGTENQRNLIHGAKIHRDAVRNIPQKFPGFVVFPQEPFGAWTNNFQFNHPGGQGSTHFHMSLELIDSLVKLYNIDPNRIYVHGLSSGGTAAWAAIYHRPDLFAACLPMSAPGDLTQVNKIAPIPIWLFQGGTDTNPIPFISQQMFAALQAAGAVDDNTRYTEYPNQGHGIWNNAYNNADFFPYMLRQSKNNIRILGVSPICPGESIKLALSANLAQYEWYKDNQLISGANTFLLENVNQAGVYSARFKRTASGPWINANPVTINVNIAGNKPSVLANKSLVLPAPDASTVTLTVANENDQYEWSNGATTRSIVVSNSGNYSVRVRPTNACWSAFSDPINIRVGSNEPGAPNGPANLKALAASFTAINLTWNDVAAETGYEIYRSNTMGGPYTYINTLPANTVAHVDSNLNPGTKYFYRVRSINSFGANMSPNEASATTLKELVTPSIPSGVFVSRVYLNYGGIELSWSPSTDNFGVKEYEIFNGTEFIGKTTSTTFFYNPPIRTIYRFFVRAIDFSGNKSEFSEQLTFAYNGNGLVAHTYGGNWTQVPNFQQLTPLRYGLLNTFTMNTSAPFFLNTLTNSALNTTNDYFGMSIMGYVQITTAGNYTFFTTSDDGSLLFVNNQQVVNNDGTHGMQERSGSVNLGVGWHLIRVDYFDRVSGQGLEVRYQGPGVSKQLIPAERLSYLNTGRDAGVGLNPPWAVPNPFNAALFNSNDKRRIRLTWSMNMAANPVAYEIFRADASNNSTVPADGNFRKVATIAANVFEYIDSLHAPGVGLTHNRYYFYRIRALGNGGATAMVASNPTNIRAVGTNITAIGTSPNNLSATALSNSVINLSWNNLSASESGFQIERANTSTGPW